MFELRMCLNSLYHLYFYHIFSCINTLDNPSTQILQGILIMPDTPDGTKKHSKPTLIEMDTLRLPIRRQ